MSAIPVSREALAEALWYASEEYLDGPEVKWEDNYTKDRWGRMADALLASGVLTNAAKDESWCPVCFEAPEPAGRWAYPGDRCADLHHEFLAARRAGEIPDLDGEMWDVAEAHIRKAKAEVWHEGYLRGVLDNEQDLEPADNPYGETL